jgi:CMP-N,N'-diacetyllegionaminic acid synthase
MEVVGLVPARGGSKGIRNKNLAPLAGKPLLAYTVEASLESEEIARTVVSTDADDIASVAETLGADVIRRPPELATDETPMRDVVAHALRELGGCDVLVLLQPTSPLRRSKHIDDAVRLLTTSGADAVVTVVEVPHRFRPDSLMVPVGRDGRIEAVAEAATRRQDKQPVLARNGPAVLVLRPSRLGDDFYAGDCRAYVMRPDESIDVDEPFDLELAEFLLARR